MATMTKKEKATFIMSTLDDLYPETPIPLDHSDPFTLLIAVLLSAQCTDLRVNLVTPALFQLASTPGKMAQQSIDDKLRQIRKEKGQQVIAKLTSRSEIVERELKVRKDYRLSRHYVPAVISVHHTVQHAAYSEAMAEPGYCITMEGADTTAENLMLDMRKAGKPFPIKALKRLGISLLHMH